MVALATDFCGPPEFSQNQLRTDEQRELAKLASGENLTGASDWRVRLRPIAGRRLL